MQRFERTDAALDSDLFGRILEELESAGSWPFDGYAGDRLGFHAWLLGAYKAIDEASGEDAASTQDRIRHGIEASYSTTLERIRKSRAERTPEDYVERDEESPESVSDGEVEQGGGEKTRQGMEEFLAKLFSDFSIPPRAREDDIDLIHRCAQRVGRVIVCMDGDPPLIQDYEAVVRRGIENGYAEMQQTLGESSSNRDKAGDEGGDDG